MSEFTEFTKVAPYLVNPLVGIGLCIFLFFGVHKALLKEGILSRLSREQSSDVVKLFLKHGFLLALVITGFGFLYAFYQARNADTIRLPPVIQQTDCGSNIVGDGSKATTVCSDKENGPTRK